MKKKLLFLFFSLSVLISCNPDSSEIIDDSNPVGGEEVIPGEIIPEEVIPEGSLNSFFSMR